MKSASYDYLASNNHQTCELLETNRNEFFAILRQKVQPKIGKSLAELNIELMKITYSILMQY